MPDGPATWPVPLTPVELHGRIVQLEVLRDDHERELSQIGPDERIWRYLSSYGGTPDAMHRYVRSALSDYFSGSAIAFVIRAISSGRVIGMTRLKSLSRENHSAIVGSWLAPHAWGMGANTEAKLLLLTYAFEPLHCIRIEFHTDCRNVRSQKALAKMGAREEGTLRSCHITRDGWRRDTVVFSILDSEWIGVRQQLTTRVEAQREKVFLGGEFCEGA